MPVAVDRAQVVIVVRRLEPRPRVLQVRVHRVLLAQLEVDAVKRIGLVALIVENGELARVKEAARSAGPPSEMKLPQLCTAVGQIAGHIRSTQSCHN